jgi:hypothetical protein
VALLDGAIEDGLEGVFFGVEAFGLAGEVRPSLPVIFATAPPEARLP